MFENSSMWISGKASEEIKNNTICIYNSTDGTIRNIKNRHEIATNVFVFVDEMDCFLAPLDYVYSILRHRKGTFRIYNMLNPGINININIKL